MSVNKKAIMYIQGFNPYGDVPEMPDMKDMSPDEQEKYLVENAVVKCLGIVVAVLVAAVLCWLVN